MAGVVRLENQGKDIASIKDLTQSADAGLPIREPMGTPEGQSSRKFEEFLNFWPTPENPWRRHERENSVRPDGIVVQRLSAPMNHKMDIDTSMSVMRKNGDHALPADAIRAFSIVETLLVISLLVICYVWMGKKYAATFHPSSGTHNAQKFIRWVGDRIYRDWLWHIAVLVIRVPLKALQWVMGGANGDNTVSDGPTIRDTAIGSSAIIDLSSFVPPSLPALRQGYEAV
eukprot:Gregarina_sp_Poly_1__6830@NODE_369_length_9158_cov_93_280497_g305_i0_p5_GENE_NODE_369_length_9158_cov_93_280497_g305_i0NODE_369_length_9158_cov_93_280497_g305_i0_p5_ORF_typecomplete_len229_score11_89_NODE_369_length_9158_cov_93_280497_g305_i027203406